MGVIVEWDELLELMYCRTDCIKTAVVGAWADPGARMKMLMARFFADNQPRRDKIMTLINCKDKAVARLVTMELLWDMTVLGLSLDTDATRALDARKARVAAEALSGDLAAQELLWGLSEEWVGTVNELICASRQLTREGPVARKGDSCDKELIVLDEESFSADMVDIS